MKRKIVYICSPFRGEYKKNIERAIKFCEFAGKKGCVPIAPHLYFPLFLSDSKPTERAVAINMGKILLKQCDEIWVFGATISEGMKDEIAVAVQNNIPIKYFEAYGRKE